MRKELTPRLPDLLLLLASGIWGFAFVAQRAGMEFQGPFGFNAIRFALGALSLIPLFRKEPLPSRRSLLFGGGLCGSALFLAASLQQVGMESTSAGRGGFLTGLYILFVPLFSLLVTKRKEKASIPAVLLALLGLYLLVGGDIRGGFNRGDILVFVSSLFWAVHILLVDRFSRLFPPLKLAVLQYSLCSVLSLASSLLFEKRLFPSSPQGWVPLLYGGFLSIGVAYTLQIVAQKRTPPSHAALIRILESPFAHLGGWLILGESMGVRGLLGCALMLAAMVISSLKSGEPGESPRERVEITDQR